jgi:seryl-tRNA synthetase
MIDIDLIREKPEWVKAQMQKLQDEAALARIDTIAELDARRRALRGETEMKQGKRNSLNKQMGRLRGNKQLDNATKGTIAVSAAAAIMHEEYDKAIAIMEAQTQIDPIETVSENAQTEFDNLIAALRELGDRVEKGFNEVKEIEAALEENMLWIPNIPHETTLVGTGEEGNKPWTPEGEFYEFDFDPKPHWDLGPELDIIDFERGVKLSGTRFYVLKGWGARLQRALISFFLDMAREKGFTEVYVPYLVQEAMLYGASQFPKFRDTVYADADADLYLVPTAEVGITNLHRDEILDESQLPLNYVGHTPCFRREKAAAGRDTRGIKRVHQFEKVEMYKFTTPETSYDELENLTRAAEDICRKLKLPFRRLEISTGDLGFSATKKYDIEVWSPGSQEWLEVSSCSNTEAFQARRAMIRYRPNGSNKTEYVHTLNGSGLATPRVIIAIMENYQNADGSITIPEVLRPYLGGAEKIEKI